MSSTDPAQDCLNCGASLTDRFCSRCGQDHRHRRLSFRDWFRDGFASLANFDSRIWRTIVGLSLRPGRFTREYVEGKRAPHTNPVKYVLTTSAIWFLIVAFVNPSDPNASSAEKGFHDFVLQYGQLVNLVALPFFIPVLQLAFWRSGRNAAELFCFVLFINGHVFLWRAGLASFLLLYREVADPARTVDGVAYLLYSLWAMIGFFRGRVRWLLPRVVLGLIGVLVTSELVVWSIFRLAGVI